MTGNINQIFNEKDYYEIRLESIGGLGANLCGKMVGELAVRYLDLNSAGFSSYGSEKTGTPVKGYIRFCASDKEIRVHSPVVNPDLLVIFHQALMRDAKTWIGCGAQTQVIIALDQGQDEWMGYLPKTVGGCYVVDARQIAMETKSRINVVMLGAMAKVMGFIELEHTRQICRDSLGRKYPAALESNLKGLEQGYEQVQQLSQAQLDLFQSKSGEETEQKMPDDGQEWGYVTAPIGGVNPRFGSTVTADLSPSRQGYLPEIGRAHV